MTLWPVRCPQNGSHRGALPVSRIFISHSSTDNAPAIALRDWLVGEGWDDLFLDLDPERGIVAGERWERALNDAARRCEAVLFLISKAWLRPAPRPAAPARIKCLLPSRTLRLGPQPFGGSWRTPEIDSPPWGELAAVDLSTNQVIWRRSLGTTRDRAPLGLPLPLGVPTLGGPVATKGGLVFIAGTIDNYL